MSARIPRSRLAIVVLFLVCLLPGISLSQSDTRPRLAVLDLKPLRDFTTEDAIAFSGLLGSAIYRTGAFQLVEREDLEKLFEVMATELVICDEAACLFRVGEYLGAEKALVGSIGKLLGKYTVTVRLVAIDSDALSDDFHESERFGAEEVEEVVQRLAAKIAGSLLPGTTTKSTTGQESPEVYQPSGQAEVVVEFRSQPSGAVVEIPGLGAFETPRGRALQPGRYTVKMTKPHFKPRSEIVTIHEGMRPLEWKLSPDYGWLTVTSDPPGLPVTIDGQVCGTTPVLHHQLARGMYHVLIQDARYYEEGRKIQIEPEEEERIAFSPPPRQGGVKVQAKDRLGNDVAGRVLVDGRDVGRTWEPIVLLVGECQIEVRSKLDTWRQRVRIEEGETITIEARITGGEVGKDYAEGSLAEQALAIHQGKVARKKGTIKILTGLVILGSALTIIDHTNANAKYDEYMKAADPAQMNTLYGEYEDLIEERNILATVSGVLIVARLLSELISVPSEEEIYHDLLGGNHVSLRFESEVGYGAVRIGFLCQF